MIITIKSSIMEKDCGKQIIFDKYYTAIIWISTHSLQKTDLISLTNTIAKHNIYGEEGMYLGGCFGGYDLVLEFSTINAKVASSYVWRLQKFLDYQLSKNYDFCPSLTLCRNIRFKDENLRDGKEEYKIRAYSLLRLKPNVVKNKLKSIIEFTRSIEPSRLLWNSSTYDFILELYGNSYQEMFDRLRLFKYNNTNSFSETCTYFTLKWDFFGESFVEDDYSTNDAPALVFVKLKEDLEGEFKGLSGCVPLFYQNMGYEVFQYKRLGSLDECLGVVKPILKDIKEYIFNLRGNNNNILSTSTVLLFPAKKSRI